MAHRSRARPLHGRARLRRDPLGQGLGLHDELKATARTSARDGVVRTANRAALREQLTKLKVAFGSSRESRTSRCAGNVRGGHGPPCQHLAVRVVGHDACLGYRPRAAAPAREAPCRRLLAGVETASGSGEGRANAPGATGDPRGSARSLAVLRVGLAVTWNGPSSPRASPVSLMIRSAGADALEAGGDSFMVRWGLLGPRSARRKRVGLSSRLDLRALMASDYRAVVGHSGSFGTAGWARTRGGGRVRIRLGRPGRHSRLGARVATAGVLF